jgi:hypothetical protein
MNSKCLELTQQVVPTVYDVTPKPEHGKVLEVDMKNRMIGDGNFFAVKRWKFHQKIANRCECLNRAATLRGHRDGPEGQLVAGQPTSHT